MNNLYIKGRISKGEFVSELFKQRVESIGGTYEANDCLVNSLNSLTDREFKDSKLILTPNGYVVDKLPTIKPNGGGDATVTRNTTKTRVNSSGLIESLSANVLAPDYLNGVCPTLNVEGQATNLLQYSENLSFYTPTGLTVQSTTDISPNGENDVYKIIPSSASEIRFLFLNSSVTNGLTYNQSVISKNTGYNFIQITGSTGFDSSFRFNVDLTTGLIGSADSQATKDKVNVIPLSNGYFLINFYAISTQTTTTGRFLFVPLDQDYNSRLPIYSGDGVSGIYAWGFQLKEGAEFDSTIITNGSSVTRSADTLTIPIPAGTTEIIEKYEDGTTNTITTIPASPYTVPTGKRYEYILMK